MGRKKHRDRWYENGRQVQRTYDSRAELEKARAKRVLGQASTPTRQSVVSTTFRQLADLWVENYAKLSKAPGQAMQDRSVINAHLGPAFGDTVVTELNEGHLNGLKVTMQRKGLKPKTIKNAMALAKAILTTATVSQDGSTKLLEINPFADVKLGKIGKQAFDYWTPDERDTFLRFCKQEDPEFYRQVTVAVFTGLRRGEQAGLRRYQLDFDRRLIQVSASFNFLVWERVNRTKNGDAEWIPMNDRAYEVLKECRLMAPNADVFPEMPQLVAKKLARLAKKFGVRPIRWHDLRHCYASCLAMAGVPLYDIQRLMRHKDIGMTQRYAHLSPQHLHESSNKLCWKQGPNEGQKEVKAASYENKGDNRCRLSDSNRNDKIA